MSQLGLPDDWIDLSDYDLGGLFLGLFIAAQAEDLGIPVDNIPDEFAERVRLHVLELEADTARLAPLEKILHKAASGDFDTAGRMLREDMIRGATELKFVSIGIKKSKQAKEFGKRGGESNREIGRRNREAVFRTANAILAMRTRKPSDRLLASEIAEETGMKESTVRGHLRFLRKEKKLD